MKYIKLNDIPDKASREAYSKGYYIEAIQILHSFLENQSRELLMLIGAVHFNADTSMTWDLTDTISFNECIKVLFILNHITKEEYEFHKKMNALRNKVIHNFCKEPYDEIYKGIPMKEYDEVFNETIEQAYFFTRKSEEIITIKK